jgi:hypothetical protein
MPDVSEMVACGEDVDSVGWEVESVGVGVGVAGVVLGVLVGGGVNEPGGGVTVPF